MNRHFALSLATAAVLCTAACSCGDTSDTPQPVTPRVESQSPVSGATDIAIEPGCIEIVFERPVTLADASGVGLTPEATVEIKVQNRSATISYGQLEYQTDYTLHLAAGTLADKSTGAPSETITVRFRTVDKPYTPPTEPAKTLVTADAMPRAQRVYDYLWQQYGHKTLSSAIAKVAWNTDEIDWIEKWTGKYPAIATFDYIHLASSPSNWIDYTDIGIVKDWWQAGGLVSACWHWNVPKSQSAAAGEVTCTPDETTFRAGNALKEGTWENARMKADLTKMADMLLLLQEQGIPVIWRPLHEAAGNTYEYPGGKAWFWWGYDGAETYVALWRTMFDYFRERGLRNLIWVWTTQTKDIDFYPGDEYVDIIGRDLYDMTSVQDIASQWNTIVKAFPHKMITLSEMGNVADIASQWEAGAKWSYFMPWYDYDNDYTSAYAHRHATIAWWKRAFASEAVLSRDDLPDFRQTEQN